MIEVAAVLTAVLCVTALTRLAPEALWPSDSRGDAAYHLLLRREIRRNAMRIPPSLGPLVLDERQNYPWLYHWLVALLPERWLERAPALPSALIDAAHAGVVVLVGARISEQAGAPWSPAWAGGIAGLAFATAPALLAVGVGPRAYSVTPRPLAELLFTLLMVGCGFFVAEGSLVALGFGALAGGLLLLTSRFATQVLVFTLPPLAFLTWQPLLLLVPFAAIGVAHVLSGGRCWHLFAGQLAHLGLYRRRLQYDHPSVIVRNRWGPLWYALLDSIKSRGRDRGALRDLARAFENSTYLQFPVRNVLLCGVLSWLAVLWLRSDPILVGGWVPWLALWAASTFLPFLLTSKSGWRFLGEAERYPEYGVAAAAALAPLLLADMTGRAPAAAGVYLLLTAAILAGVFLRKRWNARRADPGGEIDAVAKFIRSCSGRGPVLTVPCHLAWPLVLRTDRRFLATIDTEVWARDYDKLFSRYPWPNPDFGWWRRTHSAELVVFDTSAMRASAATLPHYDLAQLREVYALARYRVMAFESS